MHTHSHTRMCIYTYWNRKWQPTPVFLPGKFHGQRRLAGYSPWVQKDLNVTELTHTRVCVRVCVNGYIF